MSNDATSNLVAIENALRLAVREVLPEWQTTFSEAALRALTKKRDTETRKRAGVDASTDLLEYLETSQLTQLVKDNWAAFEPVFADQVRTETLLGIVDSYRNTAMHSRDLVPFERALIEGVGGFLRSQVSKFRSENENLGRYYPLIERITDSFNRPGSNAFDYFQDQVRRRLDIGDRVTIKGRALGARGKDVLWHIYATRDPDHVPSDFDKVPPMYRGSEAELEFEFSPTMVGENVFIVVCISGDSSHHRHGWYDDSCLFWFAVSPPEEE